MSGQVAAYDEHSAAWHMASPVDEAAIGATTLAPPSRSTLILRFLRHFGEMVLAMLLGMAVFDILNTAILVPGGLTYLADSPQAYTLAMAVAMTVPMVAWMRIRRHAWRLN